jgi:hypothetical protein
MDQRGPWTPSRTRFVEPPLTLMDQRGALDTTREKAELYRSDYRPDQGPHYAAPVQ